MNAKVVAENVVLEKNAGLEKAESVENAKVVKVENQNGQKATQTLAELLEQRLRTLNVDLSEIEFLNAIAQELKNIEAEIERLEKRKSDLRTEARNIIEKISNEAKRILEILGIVNFEEIEKTVYGKTQIAQIERAERGNGLSGKKIVFQGKQYNVATYFLRKHGITGGLKGLEQWAKTRGCSLHIENDVIYIL